MMRTLTISGAVLFLLASYAPAQKNRALYQRLTGEPRVHRLQINNGPSRTVHYFSHGMSDHDRAILRDLSEAESYSPPRVVVVDEEESEDLAPRQMPAAKATELPEQPSPEEIREQRYYLAVAQVNGSSRLCRAMGLREPSPLGKLPVIERLTPPGKGIAEAKGEVIQEYPLVVTLKEGKRLLVTRFEVTGTDIQITTTKGQTLRLKARDIARIQNPNFN